MKTHFKNTHHRNTDISEVVAKQILHIGIKRRHEDINEKMQKNKGAASFWGMLNYMPAFDSGKDDFSKQTHV